MRKCYIALLMLLAFSACQQEPVLPEGGNEEGKSFDLSKLSYNLTIEHPDGASTKGVKKKWESGDKVFLFISGITEGYLTATMTESAWNTAYVGTDLASLGASGTLQAVYLPYGNDATPGYNTGQWSFSGGTGGTDTYYFYASNIPYTVSGGILSATVHMVKPMDYVQFFIPRASATGTIQMACNALRPTGFASIAAADGTVTEITPGAAGTAVHGYPDTLEGEEGYYVSGKQTAVTNNDYYFALEKSDGTSYAHFFKHRTSAIADNKAYQLPAYASWPTVGDDRCVLVANGRWKTVNEGAANPWVMGDLKTNSFVPGEKEDLPTAADWTNLMDGNKATWKEMDIMGQKGYLVVSVDTPSNYIFLPWSTSYDSYYWITGFNNAFEIAANGDRTNNVVAPGSGEAYVRALEKLNWFKIIAEENGVITTTTNSSVLKYSKNGGASWSDYPNGGITVTAGEEVCFKAQANTWEGVKDSPKKLYSSGRFRIAGDLASLLVGDNFGTANAVIPANYSFVNFLKSCTELTDASELVLSMPFVPGSALKSFFDGCTNLVAGPAELPATTIGNQSYRNMFLNCSSLTSAPIIRNATTRNNSGWYQRMFEGCSSLQTIVFLGELTYNAGNFTDWVKGVNASGTFYKRSNMSFPAAGNSSTPTGWTIETYTE